MNLRDLPRSQLETLAAELITALQAADAEGDLRAKQSQTYSTVSLMELGDQVTAAAVHARKLRKTALARARGEVVPQ